MTIFIFDTETTGFPPKDPYGSSSWDSCRLVQIGWEVYGGSQGSSQGGSQGSSLINRESYIIRPDDFVIPEKVSLIHGIYQEDALKKGVPLSHVIERLKEILPTVNKIVAHNVVFDNKIIASELYRAKETELYKLWRNIEKCCTMLMGTQKGEKWPKLAELYERLFNKKPEGILHTADADTRICAEIYFRLISDVTLQ